MRKCPALQLYVSKGVFTPLVRSLWSECCMLPRVWFVFTRQHLQADQNVKREETLSEFRKLRSNSAELSTERTGSQALKQQQHDIRLLFRIKESVLTPAHKSQKKRQTHLLLILQSGTLPVVFTTQTYNWVVMWLSPRPRDASCLPYGGVSDSQPVGVTGRRSKTGSGRNAADAYPVEIRG